jgi:glycosyltransferase involved in cell wall biosynthesis
MFLNSLLTIVIPCKNEGLTIKKTLHLLNQQFNIDNVDVIIADSSDDNSYTRNIINNKEYDNLNIIVVDGGLPAIARNNGAKFVTTKYVLFLDSDIFIKNKYILHNIVSDINFYNLDLATCKVRTKDIYTNVFIIFDFIRSIFLKNIPFAVGGFMLFNYQTFKKIGQFNEDDKIAEDFHISKKIKPNKFKIFKYKVFTSSRRFKSKGIFYMVKIMLLSWFNKNNEDFYKKDFNYFN